MTGEIPHFSEGFYQPLQSFPDARNKIGQLLAKPPGTITDAELFEGIGDTHMTVATMQVMLRVEGVHGPQTLDDIKCLDFKTPNGLIGTGFFVRDGEQYAYIDLDDYTLHFFRDRGGRVSVLHTDDEQDDDPGHNIALDAAERRRIMEELMNCLEFRSISRIA